MTDNYYHKKQRKDLKEARERYQNLSKKERDKKVSNI